MSEFESTHYWEFREDYELMQFTGLKDRHGIEIYEGDIIQLPPNGMKPLLYFTVVWDIAVGGFRERSIEEYPYQADIDTRKLIIGNIYENPKLLK